MVDIVLLQSASYVAAAIGVCVAAVYYVMNLRETNRNRKMAFANSLLQNWETLEQNKLWTEVQHMQWTDFEDFKRKYDSSVDLQSYAERCTVWALQDSYGRQLRQGLIRTDSISDYNAFGVVLMWHKFKPIIEAYRGWELPKSSYGDWEYLAGVLEKKLMGEDPDFMKKMYNVPSLAHQ